MCVCVCIREALLKCVREKRHEVCVCLCLRSSVGMSACLSFSLHSPIDSYLFVHVCIYMSANTAERVQQHNLTVNKKKSIKSCLIFSCNYTNAILPIATHTKNHPHDTLTILRLKLQGLMHGANVINLKCV